MNNGSGNRLSIPELENQIALMQLELRRLQTPVRAHGLYTCADCGLLYQSVWGCGCVTKHIRADAMFAKDSGQDFYLSGPYHDGTYSICEVATGRIRHRFNPITDDHHVEGGKYKSRFVNTQDGIERAAAPQLDLHAAILARVSHHQAKEDDDSDIHKACSGQILRELRALLSPNAATAPQRV